MRTFDHFENTRLTQVLPHCSPLRRLSYEIIVESYTSQGCPELLILVPLKNPHFKLIHCILATYIITEVSPI